MRFVYNDGGRADAGYQGRAGDCVVRAIAIAMTRSYADVYRELAEGTLRERGRRGASGHRTARRGIHTSRAWFRTYMVQHGWVFVATMGIGTGCRVHLATGELPLGRLIVSVSKHYTTVIDGVIHDTHDPSREGTRCVYGYWHRVSP
jgi:hypothetical protein